MPCRSFPVRMIQKRFKMVGVIAFVVLLLFGFYQVLPFADSSRPPRPADPIAQANQITQANNLGTPVSASDTLEEEIKMIEAKIRNIEQGKKSYPEVKFLTYKDRKRILVSAVVLIFDSCVCFICIFISNHPNQ
ncbi:UDP-glucuronic acid decarboxylase 1 [Biomphalaria glabrata]|nr:UDP-glucuronic acid decarboxylase 1 [Biomphalaria glabrata]